MKILLAVDGSPLARSAALHLVPLVKAFAAAPELHVLHVHAPIPYPRAVAVAGQQAVVDYQREESEAALAVASKELAAAGVDHTTVWQVGEPVHVIDRYVKLHGIDLVVLASRGHGGLANLALGSIATKCIATLAVPVLVAPRVAPVSAPRTTRKRATAKT